jgi:hypothetical protein
LPDHVPVVVPVADKLDSVASKQYIDVEVEPLLTFVREVKPDGVEGVVAFPPTSQQQTSHRSLLVVGVRLAVV